MNIITKLITKPKASIIAGSLLFGLALTPLAASAAKAEREGYRNGEIYLEEQYQGNRHSENNMKRRRGHNGHHSYADRHHPKKHGHQHRKYRHPGHKHHKYISHSHREPHYKIISNDHHHYNDHFGLQIGVHTGNFDIIFRD